MSSVKRLSLLGLVLLVLPHACQSGRHGEGVAGDWQGVVLLPQIRRNVTIHFKDETGRCGGVMDVPATMSFSVPLANLRCNGNNVEFALPSRPGGNLQFHGTVREGALKGSITGEQFSGSFELRRAEEPTSRPETPLDASWKPVLTDSWPINSWRLTSPASEDLDSVSLSAAERHIQESLPEVRSLVIVRHGRIAFEKYFYGTRGDEVVNIKSVTKSFTSALVGIALREGILHDLDQTVASILPEYFGPETDPRKRKITLRHLLTMTAGFEWTENGPSTLAWHQSRDFARFVIDQPLAADPGQTGQYNTALSHLLSIILTRQSRLSTRQFAERYLLEPIGIGLPQWGQDPNGYFMGGVDLFLTPRDMARFGLLYLHLGRWKDRQVVPAAWVRESMSPKFVRDPLLHNYGYLWWLVRDDSLPAFAAIGYGGQLIYVCPQLDLVVVMTSTIHDRSDDVLRLVREFVVPAAKPGGS